MDSKRATLIFLIALLVSVQFATIATSFVGAQQEMTPAQTLETQEQYVKLAFSADGKHVAAMSNRTETLSIFNRTHMLWETPVPGIRAIAISENASIIAAAATNSLNLFNTQNSAPQTHLDLNCENPLIALSDDGNIIALAATPKERQNTTNLYLFETRNQNPTWNTTLQGTLESASISGDGNYTTVSTSQPGVLYLFSKHQPTPLWTHSFGEQSGAAQISRDGNYIITTGGNLTGEHNLRVYRFHKESAMPNYIKIISELPPASRLSVSSEGSIFTLGFAQSNRLIFFNLDLPPYGYGPGSVLNISLPSQPTSMSMSQEGKYTAVGTHAGMYVYDYMNNQLSLAKQFTSRNPLITDVAMTPNGWLLAAAATEKQNDKRSAIYFFDVVETRNGDPSFWFRTIILVAIVLVGSTASIYLLRKKHKPQKPADTI